MKKISFLLCCVIVVAGVVAALQHGRKSENPKPARAKETVQKPVASEVERTPDNNPVNISEQADALVKKMTLKEKIGQMMMVGFYGTKPDYAINNLIREQKIGGVIYFDRNMQSPKQVAELSNTLQHTAAAGQPHHLPLLFGTDQEGGEILRMRNKVSPIPSQQVLGKSATARGTYNIAKINGSELAAMGIHLDFAPVLDVSDQDSRSFGSDPLKTYQFGQMAVKGLNDAGVTAVLKHFPGNGRAKTDPHLDTSTVQAGRTELEQTDMVPFKKMIQNENGSRFFVMVTHVKYPAYDAVKPASISPAIIQSLLRDRLKYQGIVISDDLEMGAVSNHYSFQKLGKEAVKAGVDILLVCHEYEHQKAVYQGILSAVRSGEIKESRIDESVRRIVTYKLQNQYPVKVNPATAAKTVGSSAHKKLVEENHS
mgnify:CR=1 FL=1